MLAQSLTSCVLEQVPQLSVPRFPLLENGDNNSPHRTDWWGLVNELICVKC